jgi:hypothetical protein
MKGVSLTSIILTSHITSNKIGYYVEVTHSDTKCSFNASFSWEQTEDHGAFHMGIMPGAQICCWNPSRGSEHEKSENCRSAIEGTKQ